MPKDMRSWIADLDAAGELIRIDKPVDPLTQMGSLLYQSREKALLFEKLAHGWRSLGQAPANFRAMRRSPLATTQEELVPLIAERMARADQAGDGRRRARSRKSSSSPGVRPDAIAGARRRASSTAGRSSARGWW